MPRADRGALPQGGAQAPRRDRRAPRPLRLAPPPAARAGGRRRAGRGARPEWWVVLDFLRADRPRAARAPGPQDDQPPVLERRRGGRAPAARDRARARARRRGARRRQPAAGRGRAATRRPGDDGGGLPHRRPSTCRRTRSSTASRAGSRRTSPPSSRTRSSGWTRRSRELADALAALPPRRGRGGGPLDRHPDGPARRARPALPDRPARVRQHRQGVPRRSRTSTSSCQRIVYPPRSHGRLGRQGGGPLPRRRRSWPARPSTADVLGDIRMPRSWYIPSDGILDFIHHNDLEDVYNRKYTDPDRVRLEYPYIVQLFKNSLLLRRRSCAGLSVVLDDLDGPARSSCAARACSRTASAPPSRASTRACSWPTPGTKRERLAALIDAIAEVYASVFGPDPIEYRARARAARPPRGDGHPDPGGRRHAGRPLLPARLLRGRLQQQRVPLVAADPARGRPAAHGARARHARGRPPRRRLPGAASPRASPGLRVNADRRTRRCATRPKKVDVINLETGVFETVEIARPARAVRRRAAAACARWSRSPTGRPPARARSGSSTSTQRRRSSSTFEGLARGHAVRRRACARCCRCCARSCSTPVDIEFASRRPATSTCCSAARRARPRARRRRAIPRDVPPERVLFTAHRYVSNGQVPRHHATSSTSTRTPTRALELADACARSGAPSAGSTALLPKRQFILMGPGRWGSRGDIRLGVPRHLRRHQQHGDARRGRAQEGRLRARPLVRHALLPGPRRVVASATCRSTPTTPASSSTRPSSCGAPNALAELRPRVRARSADVAARDRRAARPPAGACCAC